MIGSLQLVEESLPVAALCEFTRHPASAEVEESLMRTNGAGESIKMVARLGAALPPEAVNHQGRSCAALLSLVAA